MKKQDEHVLWRNGQQCKVPYFYAVSLVVLIIFFMQIILLIVAFVDKQSSSGGFSIVMIDDVNHNKYPVKVFIQKNYIEVSSGVFLLSLILGAFIFYVAIQPLARLKDNILFLNRYGLAIQSINLLDVKKIKFSRTMFFRNIIFIFTTKVDLAYFDKCYITKMKESQVREYFAQAGIRLEKNHIDFDDGTIKGASTKSSDDLRQLWGGGYDFPIEDKKDDK